MTNSAMKIPARISSAMIADITRTSTVRCLALAAAPPLINVVLARAERSL